MLSGEIALKNNHHYYLLLLVCCLFVAFLINISISGIHIYSSLCVIYIYIYTKYIYIHVAISEGSKNAACYTPQPGATAEHQSPWRSTCSMTLRTNLHLNHEFAKKDFGYVSFRYRFRTDECSRTKNRPYLTADERQTLRSLRRNAEVVIRETDKESAVVIMSRERYIAEAYRQLSDTDVYQQVSSNVCFDVIEVIKEILLSHLQRSGVIPDDMATYSVPVDSKPTRFYLLPKGA